MNCDRMYGPTIQLNLQAYHNLSPATKYSGAIECGEAMKSFSFYTSKLTVLIEFHKQHASASYYCATVNSTVLSV